MNAGWIGDSSPHRRARLAGAIAWITTTSGYAAVVRGKLVVFSDAATRAHEIGVHERNFVWRSRGM